MPNIVGKRSVINWSERSACDQRSNLGRPLFLVINLFLLSYLIFLIPLFKTPEGVVVGFQIFAWTPKKK
jgi:hypothetical protein